MSNSATENHNEETTRKERLERRAKRAKKLDQSEQWDPDEGDTIMGEIYGWQKRENPQYGTYYIVFLKDEDGDVYGLPTFHGVLQSELKRTGTTVGDLVVVIYNGKVEYEEEDRNGYHNYTVVSESEEVEENPDDIPFPDPQE